VDATIAAGCSPIVLVVPATHLDHARELASEYPQLELVKGGASRQESVANGLQVVDADAVVVHDAARPLAPPELVSSVVSALDDADAVIAAVPVDETLKRVDEGTRVIETIDRSVMWRAQTPAAFLTHVLKEAHRRADQDGFTGTDESQLVERVGGVVRIVKGNRDNLKVTFPEDLALAEAMIAVQK
jgi:2-C-methyl-D-erythritol 4-phosphate cytidylyltransferase